MLIWSLTICTTAIRMEMTEVLKFLRKTLEQLEKSEKKTFHKKVLDDRNHGSSME